MRRFCKYLQDRFFLSHLCAAMYHYLTDEALNRLIDNALAEDLGPTLQDHTTLATIPYGQLGTARCLIKEDGVLAGVQFAQRVFSKMDSIQVSVQKMDGDTVHKGDIAFTATGPIQQLLMAERLVLNAMQRMSGIATTTRAVVESLKGTHCRVLDTRKTTPNLRVLEKWAVQIAGGVNHRFGLFDMILIKDNHVDACGGIHQALDRAATYLKTNALTLDIEIETRTLAEVQAVVDHGGAQRILLDNMDYATLRQAVHLVAGRIPTEASGGITPDNAREYAMTGVDYLSMGALTHSVKSLDISLKLVGM